MKWKTFFCMLLAVLAFSCRKGEVEKAPLPVPVRVYVVQPDSISRFLPLPGTLEASSEALVYARVSERLIEIRVEVGDRVTPNQLLGRQEGSLFWEALQQAQAAASAAETRYRLAKEEYERTRRLYQQGAVNKSQYDQVTGQYWQARAAWRQAQAALNQAREQYAHTELRAPIAGTVASIFYRLHELVPVGQPVFRIVNPSLMRSKLALPEGWLQKVHPGQPVVAQFPALGNQTYRGRVHQLDQAVDPISRTVGLEVILENTDGKLLSGLFGQFQIQIEKREQAVVIPENAVLSRTQLVINPRTGLSEQRRNYYVFVVEQGKAHLRYIEPGIESNGRLEVVSGLAEGDSVIVVGQRLVKAGTLVRVVE